MYELDQGSETIHSPSQATGASAVITLQEAIHRGEYDPEYLGTFPEWHQLPRHIQFQYIREALQNRERHLVVQWAEIANILNFSQKPHLQKALKNIEKQKDQLHKDKETLYTEYSHP